MFLYDVIEDEKELARKIALEEGHKKDLRGKAYLTGLYICRVKPFCSN